MTNTFFISDTHFGHHNAACVFEREDGSKLRPYSNADEMDEDMIAKWNNVVSPKDRVYHLGDFCMQRKKLQVLHRLNGRICIVLGNHDPWKKRDWDQFQNVDHILGAKMMPKLGWVITHIPVYEDQLHMRWSHNIHGHLHANIVKDKHGKPDRRYFNVSVEQINFTPIELEELKAKLL